VSTPAVEFRFDAGPHEYTDLVTGNLIPHITGMLQQTGWIDDTWFTEESSDRGTAVHKLTADYDLEALDLEQCVSPFRSYLLAHVKVVSLARPVFEAVEQPLVHSRLHFGGRPDRLVRLYGLMGVWEIKSGEPKRSDQVQTALQAILAEEVFRVPATALERYCCYLKPTGRAVLEEHVDRRDFDEARRVIRATVPC
jgi:hypothetical protein